VTQLIDLLRFEEVLRSEIGLTDSFDQEWRALRGGYTAWLETPAAQNTSELNRRLELMRMVSAMYGEQILESPPLLELSLAGTASIGGSVELLIGGRRQRVKVVGRSLTPRLAVLYVLERNDGTRFTHEFFD